MIEVHDLVKKYGEHMAVDHLSFTVDKGQIYGFLGPNGAGKTTTMNIITGYTGMTEGRVTVDGIDIVENPLEAKRRIGYLPETPPLYMDMTPFEYLDFVWQLKKLPVAKEAEELSVVMERTGLTGVSRRIIKNLSKGYRQRVGLAQAILGLPPVIILDEPTVGLDPKQILEVRSLIKSLAGEHTVILSSHILSEVQEICDKIMIINHGKLVASGTPSELERSMRSSCVELIIKSQDLSAVTAALKRVPGAERVETALMPDGTISASVYPHDSSADIREAVFSVCCNEKLPVLKMDFAGMSLERIFLELTGDGDSTVDIQGKCTPESPKEEEAQDDSNI